MSVLFFSFLFFLPAGIANMMPVFASKIPILREYCYPLDFGLSFRGKRIFGDHKTIRGLLAGVFAGVLGVLIEQHLGFLPTQNPLLLGFLLSFGALIGDSIKSFFKRQIGIPSGKSWFPFDQIDYIMGGIFFSLFVVELPLSDYLIIISLYFILHLLISYTGFLLGLKNNPI